MEKIAVVIPVKNEEQGLEELIASLAVQVPQNGEIIFVDAGSSDDTVKIIEKAYIRDSRIRLFLSSGAFPGKGRNVAVRNTDASIIAHVDGGNLPEKDWLEKICKPILSGEADYVGGGFKVMPVKKSILGMEFDMADVYGASVFRTLAQDQPIAGGFSVAYRRWVWERAGGLPEWTPVGEDILFSHKVRTMGTRAVFAGDAVVYWQVGPGLLDVLRRQAGYQKVKLLHHDKIFQSGGSALLPIVMLIMLMLSLFLPFMLAPTIFTIVAQCFRQSAKTLSVFCARAVEAGWRPRYSLSVPAVLLLEFLTVFARMYGALKGILALGERKDFEARVRDYLSGAGKGGENGV